MPVARIVVQVLDGDTVVHEYRRATSQPNASNVSKMCTAAMGWLQAWSGVLSEDQWRQEAERARASQQ